MNQAITESTMSTAGLSNRLIERCTLLGAINKAQVSNTRLQINGAMVIPRAYRSSDLAGKARARANLEN